MPPGAVRMVEMRKVVCEDGIAVFVGVFGYLLDELGLGGALHVERDRQQEPAQLLVDSREVHKMPEVEPRVLVVVLATHPLGEEHAVRREQNMDLAASLAHMKRNTALTSQPANMPIPLKSILIII